jgi:uncharacterized membrane protein YhiD involved in acid resistance
MPEWLNVSVGSQPGLPWQALAIRLAAAAAFGLVVTWLYRATRDAARISASFPGTLSLLCVLIAMVTQVIGDNVALAFSLVGALSIVRFRTVVQDTRDTAFVIFAVAVGMAIGAGQPAVAVAGTIATGAVAWLFRDAAAIHRGRSPRAFAVVVRAGADAAVEGRVCEVLGGHGDKVELVGSGTAKKGMAVRIECRLLLPADRSLAAVVAELKTIPMVQSVDIRQPRSGA